MSVSGSCVLTTPDAGDTVYKPERNTLMVKIEIVNHMENEY